MDSWRGAVVLFYMDKQINEKLLMNSSTRAELRQRDLAMQNTVRHNNQQRYLYFYSTFAKSIYGNFCIAEFICLYMIVEDLW